MKIKIHTVGVSQGGLYEVRGEDCSHFVFDSHIVATLADGRQLVSLTLFVSGEVKCEDGFSRPNYNYKNEVAALLERVQRRGVIESDLWSEMPQEESLEERWAGYAEEEEMERRGWR
jgi:hypothetical protein